MGQRNPDRVPFREWRYKYETVAEIRRAGWAVISRCTVCSLDQWVDLAEIERVSGPATSLWNRRKRCRRLFCKGVAILWARPPWDSGFTVLEAPWPEGKPSPSSPAGSRAGSSS